MGAVLEETLALPGAAAVSSLANGDGIKDSEEGGDELHFGGGLSGWWIGVEMLEACGLMMVNVSTAAPYIAMKIAKVDISESRILEVLRVGREAACEVHFTRLACIRIFL